MAVDLREYQVLLTPPITPVSELYVESGWKPPAEEDFERLTADDAPPDEEG